MPNLSKFIKSAEDKIRAIQELCLFTEPSLKRDLLHFCQVNLTGSGSGVGWLPGAKIGY